MFNLILISTNIILLYLIIILISFDPSDPGWMQLQSTWHGSICNQGGIIGAQLADFLFFCFGSVAYIMPIVILVFIWIFFVKKININIFRILLISFAILILFVLFCLLAHLIIGDVFYFSSGGMIGSILHTIVSTDHNIILNVKYVLFYISIISIVYFSNNFINVISYFFSKKRKQKNHLYKQAYFNTRISPSVFLYQKSTLFQNPIYHSSQINQNLSIYSNISGQFKKNLSKNHLNQIRFISSTHDISDQYKSTVKHQLSNLKLNTKHIKCVPYNILYRNNIPSFSKKNINQYTKKIQNNNNLSTIHTQSYINNKNVSKQKKIMFINKDNCQFDPISVINNVHKTIHTQKKSEYFKNIHANLPNINLLVNSINSNKTNNKKFKTISQLIEQKLSEYHIIANVATIISGPVITRFDLNLSAGIKSSKITNLSRDLARSLSVASVRVIEIVPGTPYVGLEIPNEKRDIVYLGDIINSKKFKKNNSPLALVLGKDVIGQPIIEDLRYMPHLLVAGTTGSGKSIGINVMIISILYKSTPEDVRFIMIDPKILELSIYSKIPHLLQDVITNMQDVESTLQWCVNEMEHRYKLMSNYGVRNLESYNRQIDQLILKKNNLKYYNKSLNTIDTNDIIYFSKKPKKLPYIVVIIDEFSDVMITTTKKVETLIIRLIQKSRAAGMHIILATQRPSVDVITGVIKANIPARIAFTVSSKIDSRTILGQSGAESLLGMGDMLYLSPNSSTPIRIHGAYITDTEISSVVNFWKK